MWPNYKQENRWTAAHFCTNQSEVMPEMGVVLRGQD